MWENSSIMSGFKIVYSALPFSLKHKWPSLCLKMICGQKWMLLNWYVEIVISLYHCYEGRVGASLVGTLLFHQCRLCLILIFTLIMWILVSSVCTPLCFFPRKFAFPLATNHHLITRNNIVGIVLLSSQKICVQINKQLLRCTSQEIRF